MSNKRDIFRHKISPDDYILKCEYEHLKKRYYKVKNA